MALLPIVRLRHCFPSTLAVGIQFLTFLLFRRPWLPIIHETEVLEPGSIALKMEDMSLQSFAFLICAVRLFRLTENLRISK